MKSYLFWVVYYTLGLIDSIGNFLLSFIRLGGLFKLSDTFFISYHLSQTFRILNKREKVRGKRADEAEHRLNEIRDKLMKDD